MNENNSMYLKDTWSKTLNYIRESGRLDASIINGFFETSTLYEFNDHKAIIVVPSIIHKNVVANENDLIQEALESVANLTTPIVLDVVLQSEVKHVSTTINNEDTIEIPIIKLFSGQPLSLDKTFDNFVVGDCNRESHAAALASAYEPGKFFNPLFIYGNSGLGKTHLLQSIGNYVVKQDPSKKVYYTDSLKFVETVVDSIKEGKIDAFKKYMYSLDVLLIDDIQFLAGKEKSHEVFFTIFNELVNNRKQIVIASDRLPQEIKGLEERLISRFSSGLSVGIDSPEFETSLAILKMKLQSSGVDSSSVDEDVLTFIASNFNRDVRQLEGALNRVLFYAIEFQKDGGRISFETASSALKGQTVVSDKSGVSPKKIIKCVADYYGLTKQQITSKTRTKNIAMARHISIYLCRKLLDLPYIKIGEEFGGRDHSTIMSACEKVEKNIKQNPSYAQALNEIEKIVNN